MNETEPYYKIKAIDLYRRYHGILEMPNYELLPLDDQLIWIWLAGYLNKIARTAIVGARREVKPYAVVQSAAPARGKIKFTISYMFVRQPTGYVEVSINVPTQVLEHGFLAKPIIKKGIN